VKNREYTHPALDEFAKLAATFCSVIENTASEPAGDRLNSLHVLLPRIYAAALELEATSVLFDDDDSVNEEAPSTDSSRGESPMPAALDDLADYLGARRYYREIFDPYSEPSEAEVVGDLIDDFGDIYRELSGGLSEWQAGTRGEALWEWRFGFEGHWGEHATSALRALFALCAWRDEDWPAG
jgi:hypothetical protein